MPVGTESAPAPREERLQVGDWTVEPALNQLSAAGKTVKLEPKAMSVLVYLADRPGQVVSRDALLSAVWSGVVVGDDSLTQVVIKLRKALGDVAGEAGLYPDDLEGGLPAGRPGGPIGGDRLRAGSAGFGILHAERKRRVPWIAGAGIAALLLAAAGVWWIEGERVTGVPPGQAPMPSTEAARTAQPTITIRPFEALGNDPQAVLLARGITADLVTDLSKVSGLSVIGVAPLGGQAGAETPTDAPPIRYLVSGSVQRVDERLRLHVHLTDARDGETVVVRAIRPRAERLLRDPGRARAEDSPDSACEGERGRTAACGAAPHPQSGSLRILPARAVGAARPAKSGERDRSRNVPARHRAGRGLCSCVCRARTDLRRGLPQSVDRQTAPPPSTAHSSWPGPHTRSIRTFRRLTGCSLSCTWNGVSTSRRCSTWRPPFGSTHRSPMAMR